MAKRTYTLGERARKQEETRARILDATIALHEEVGPARTTVSAIAERAGVQRLTVYRHFPDETTLLEGCSSRWIGENPPPAPDAWRAVADPPARARDALRALADYYRRTEPMWRSLYRDVAEVEALARVMKGFEAYLDDVRDDLLRGWRVRGKRRAQLRAVVAHALQFATWASLADQGLDDDEIASLASVWIVAVTTIEP